MIRSDIQTTEEKKSSAQLNADFGDHILEQAN